MLPKSLKKTEEQKSSLVRLRTSVEKYKKYYSTHWMVVKAPDQSQKLSNDWLWKAKFRGPFSAKNCLILLYIIHVINFDRIILVDNYRATTSTIVDSFSIQNKVVRVVKFKGAVKFTKLLNLFPTGGDPRW